ncbi:MULTISPECIES: hypothetical protein [Flavobacterium]|uniref:hypothetical protein n=1 Tax=Flavobacterium TaxID=237 RepID=UPI002114D7DB|nr:MULTISPECIES: hypothetical protein [Flavobacterium]UUF13909.1 hypothetical protein NLJ00_21900 [Flavobacterium panici]
MKLKIIGIPIFLLLIVLASSCKSTPDLTEDEVYGIINEIVVDDSLFLDHVCWEFRTIPVKEEYKKEFSEKDIDFINEQNENFKGLKIKPNKIKWFRKSKKVFQYAIVDTLCDQGFLYHISFPIISADRKKVIIEFQEDCNCLLGGQGGKYLYEKKNGHWIQKKGYDQWISQNEKPQIKING